MKILTEKKYNELTAKIQATEGERHDVLTSGITGSGRETGDVYIDKNNYPTYAKQIQAIYDIYNAESSYGAEILGSIIDTRISFIGGSGISIKTASKSTGKFINKLLKENKMLKGSNLLDLIKITEMEGKVLLKASPKNKDDKNTIRIISVDYHKNPYEIEVENKEIKKIILGKKLDENRKELSLDSTVFIRTGGIPSEFNNTVPKIAKILTQIVNLSRAKYDMRGNNHLYARPQWYALTNTVQEAKSLNATIEGKDMTRTKSYVGTARQVGYLEPSGSAQTALEKEIIINARDISTNTGIPIHWLAYPDLMSNRATAENMLEMINASTIQERLRIEEGVKELIQKCMIMAMEIGMEGAVNDPEGFEVKLDLVSYANLKQIQETWIPLAEGEFISRETVMSNIPGIDPQEEKKLLEKEKEKRMENMPSFLAPNSVNNKDDQNNNQSNNNQLNVDENNDTKKK